MTSLILEIAGTWLLIGTGVAIGGWIQESPLHRRSLFRLLGETVVIAVAWPAIVLVKLEDRL